MQLLLTPNAAAILDNMNQPNERAGDSLIFLLPSSSALCGSFAELRQQQAIYRALQIIGGHIGLPIRLLFSIFSKTAQRDLTFHNFYFTWIFSSVTFSFGTGCGRLYRLGPASLVLGCPFPFIQSDQECLTQAALGSGAQAMTDTAMSALIVQLWFDFKAAIHEPRSHRQIRWTRATLLAAPYVAQLAFSLPAVGAGDFANRLRPPEPYLSAHLTWQTNYDIHSPISQYTLLLSILIVTLVFDSCIIHILYRRWGFFNGLEGRHLEYHSLLPFRSSSLVYRLVVAVKQR
ncbi:hypothetical protein JB92DRAFT_2836601 [Gautieria morchelliformis]|nr:hypothetical protein JB92DRAFT_2836601 [Gautieria morchelliformis]